MQVLSSIFYLVIVLGVLVFIHEFGHFIAAKLSKMRVDVFSLGMGYRIFGYNKDKGFTFGALPEDYDPEGDTDYRLSVFPIGGYVKIVGMIDESMDTEFASGEIQDYEFRAKNPFQKIFTLSAGVIMNLVLAIVIYGGISFFIGSSILKTVTVGEVQEKSVASAIGFQTNDKIISINDREISTWNDVLNNMILEELGNDLNIYIQRESKDTILKIEAKPFLDLLTAKKELGLNPGGIRTIAMSISKNSPAEKAGIQPNDTIWALNNAQIDIAGELQEIVKANKGKEIPLTLKRGGKLISTTVKPNESGLIGVGLAYGPIEYIKYGFFEAVWVGTKTTFATFDLIVKSIGQIFTGKMSAKDSLGGPIMIADQANQMANRGLVDFLGFMAMLSVSLAFLNILPIPALDGGHILIVIIEAIIRKELPEKLKIAIQQVGLFFILGLMILVFYNDIARYFFN